MQLCLLTAIGLTQCYDVISFFVHVTRYPSDGTTFARSISPIEKDHHFLFGSFQMTMHFNELGLVRFQFLFVIIFL